MKRKIYLLPLWQKILIISIILALIAIIVLVPVLLEKTPQNSRLLQVDTSINKSSVEIILESVANQLQIWLDLHKIVDYYQIIWIFLKDKMKVWIH